MRHSAGSGREMLAEMPTPELELETSLSKPCRYGKDKQSGSSHQQWPEPLQWRRQKSLRMRCPGPAECWRQKRWPEQSKFWCQMPVPESATSKT